MPRKNSKSAICPLDIKLFEPSILRDPSFIEIALANVARCVRNATIDSAVELMLVRPHLVEFVWSASDEETSAILTERILNGFPTSPDDFINSLAYRLLDTLSLSLLFMMYPSPSETPDGLPRLRRDVELTSPVLQALTSLISMEDSPVDLVEEDTNNINIKVKQSQRKRKIAKRGGRGSTIDSKPFDNMKLSIPMSSAEAKKLATDLILQQKQTLEIYLDVLRRPGLIETFKLLYIPEEVDAVEASVSVDGKVTVADDTVVETEAPSAYPMVQPMKAALYFDSAEGLGEWRILMSTKAEKNLREFWKQDGNMFKIILKKIKELSNGHFSGDNQKRLTGPGTEVPIFEAKMTRDTRLVYQVDCIPEYDSEIERQVLKIFGIYTHAQLDARFWDSMGHQLSNKGREYRARCIFRNKPYHIGDNVIMPATFPPPEDAPSEHRPLLELRKEDLEELHSLLVLEKFVTFSQALLNSILADQDVAHVFNVSPQEKQIIEHVSSCYVLGRSGTGKTTTMLFKMLGIERSSQLLPDVIAKPRQLFVTQSRVLAGKVEEYFSKLIESLVTASHSPQELKRLATNKDKHEEGLIDLDDEEDWRSDLPKKFSLLKDEHFPMFITFDRLCALLEADINEFSRPYAAFTNSHMSEDGAISPTSPTAPPITSPDPRLGNQLGENTSSGDYMQQRRASFVSYGTFLESYWNHFPQTLTKGLDPSLVFSEFMGVIKGSELTLDQPDSFLDRAAYESLSHRSQATFASHRDHIYSLFLAYLKRKRTRGDYDAADRTHAIVEHVRENGGVFGRKIDFLYVDEVQDNLLVDSLLLRSICSNPNGLFWAGDTAQTISVGSAFKFTDLKAFQFRIEKQMTDSYRLSIPAPREFQLTVNYRSHGGIVNCAHSVVELITKFWPYSIDVLAPERGIVNGLKPIFFTGWDQDTVRYEQFLFGSAGSQIEFGAQQCILVRHDAARNKLRQQVGDIGLIMTLYESKGLEFNDVLLYNFFEDSTADLSQWRVVLNAIEKSERGNIAAPRFDDNRHAAICSELKFLYVAITRARKNLWVVDRSERGEPIRIYWTSRDQVENCDPSSQVPHLAVSSSPEEWVKTGETLFRNKRYLQAMHSFERAGRPRDASVCHAYFLREQARLVPKSTRPGDMERSKAFIKAAGAFRKCATEAEERQGRQRRVWYRTAAECFANAGEEGKAAEAYVNASEFTLGARHYRKAGMFDRVVDVIQTHGDRVEPATAAQLMDVSRIFYFKQNRVDDAVKLFSSPDDALEFMEDYDLDIARATALVAIGRYGEAAELHIKEGRTLEAIKILITDSGNRTFMQRASQCLLDGLWQNLSFAVSTINQTNPVLSQLLDLAAYLNMDLLAASGRHEISMFQCIASGDFAQIPDLAKHFLSSEADNVPGNNQALLLCLDHFFSTPPKIQAARTAEVIATLGMFWQYVTLLRQVTLTPSFNDRTRRLFGFKVSEDRMFFLPTGTFLHTSGLHARIPTVRTDENGMTISEWEFSRLFKNTLLGRLRERIRQENELCKISQALNPCLAYSLSGQCNRVECHNSHIPPTALTPGWYTSWVRLHLIQIQILQIVDLDRLGRYEIHRYWLGRLYETLHPAFFKHGSSANLALEKIPEAVRALPIIKEWISGVLYMLDPSNVKHYLTTIMRTATLGFTFDPHATIHCLTQANCYMSELHQPLALVRQRSRYVVHDFVASLHGVEYTRLSAGVLFLLHISGRQIQIDIGALCHFMEAICGSLILSLRYQRGGDINLHDIVLPRSWFIDLFGTINHLDRLDTQMTWKFLDSIPNLLEALSSDNVNQDFLLFEGRNIRSWIVRQIFIARICRTICLFEVGYNIRSHDVKTSIVQIISKLPKQHRSAHSPYTSATDWNDLVRAMRNSQRDSPFDQLIRLEHTSMKTASPPGWCAYNNCRTINYQKVGQIPEIIQSGSSGPKSTLRAEAVPFVPVPHASAAASNDPQDEDIEAGLDDGDVEGHDDDVREDVDVEAVSLAMSSNPVVGDSYSQEHAEAASRIQRVYRLHCSKRKAGAKGELLVRRNRLFCECLTASLRMNFPYPHYRKLFLGPLPHILVCLEGIFKYVQFSKSNVKKRLGKAAHQELEDLMQQQTKYSTLQKQTIRLQKALGHNSELHQKRDLKELTVRVLEVEQLMEEIPTAIQQEYAADLNLGVTGIARPRNAVNRKKPKPELIIESDLEI